MRKHRLTIKKNQRTLIIVGGIVALLLTVGLIGIFIHSRKKTEPKAAPAIQTKTPSVDEKPELYYLSIKEVTEMFGAKIAKDAKGQTRTMKTMAGKMEEFVPYVVVPDGNTTNVYYRTDKGIERYSFSPSTIDVALSEKSQDSKDFEIQSTSTPMFQYKDGEAWLDYEEKSAVSIRVDKGPDVATITQKTKAGANDAKVTWKFGIQDQRLILKNTFELSDTKHTNRLLWTISFPKDKKIISSDDEATMHQTENMAKKRIKLGNVNIGWDDFNEPTKAALSAANQTLIVLFYEDGIEGNLTIDPTLTTTVNAAASEIDIEVTDGTRWWCFGKNPQETAATRSLFQPTRMFHSSISAPTNCTTGGDDFLPNNAGSLHDSPLFSGTNGFTSTSAITVNLLETTATRARVQTYKDNTLDSRGLFTVYPNGYGYFNYALGTANSLDQSYTFSEHFKSANAQTELFDSTNRTYVIADTSNTNYAGVLGIGYQILGIPLMPDLANDSPNDLVQYWNSNTTTTSPAQGTKTSSAWTGLLDLSEYRASNFTKDVKLGDYRLPDDVSDGLTNSVLWDDAGEQAKYFTGFEGADTDLCGGGDGFTTGSCNGDDTAVGNDKSNAYSGTYAAHFDGGATTTDVAYAQLTMDANPRQTVRFMLKVNTETLGTNQEMTIVRFIDGSNNTNGSLAFRQNASNQLVLCVTPQRGGTGGTQVCGTTVLSTGTWYAVEFTNTSGITSGTSYGNHVQVFLNGVVQATSVQNVAAAVTTTAMRMGLVVTSTANNDIYIDNVAIDYTETGIPGFNAAEGAYTLQHAKWGSDLSVDLDRGGKIASGSAFKIRGWQSQNDPTSVKLENTQLINGTDFNADVLPFSESWVNDSDGTCGTGGWQKLANGGDLTNSSEYLMRTDNDYNFNNGGSGNNCTFGDSTTDALYFGRTDQFSGLNVLLSTVGTDNSLLHVTWEYCSVNTDVATACDTWSTLSVTSSPTGVSDFVDNGSISFTPPSQWIRSRENSGREALYFVRARVTSAGYGTYPVEQKITTDILAMQYQGTLTQDDQTFTFSTTSPVGVWKIDEGNGTTIGDSTGLGNSLTINGAVWRGDGQRNNSSTKRATYLHFDGSNDFASRANDTDFNPGGEAFTLTGWFRHPLAVSGTDTILAHYGTAGYKVYMNSSGNICFGIDDDSSWGPDDSACTTTTYTDSTWHHFAAVRNGVLGQIGSQSNLMLYIDGKFQASDGTISAKGSLDTSSTLYFGIDSDGSSNPWDGEIDEVNFYRYALTAAQVLADIPDPSSALVGNNPTDPLTNGLVGWWKMDESIGNLCSGGTNDTCDSSGNGYDAAWGGNATSSAVAKFGYSTIYDGSSTNAAGDVLDFERTQPFSLGTWIKTTTDGAQSLITKQDDSSPFSGYNLQFGSSGILYFQLVNTFTTNNIQVQSTNDLSYSDGNWHYVAATYDGSSKGVGVRLYFDGTEIPVTVSMDNLSATTVNAIPLNFGSRNSSTQKFTGNLDEARIYNRIISPAEVRALYSYAPGPMGYWKFDEASGTSAADSSGNNYSATITDAGTVGGFEPGIYGNTYNMKGFNGSGADWMPISGTINLGSVNTISFWINGNQLSSTGHTIGSSRTVTGGAGADPQGYMAFIDDVNLYSRQSINPGAVSVAHGMVAGTWYHIEVVRDGTSVKFYKNGVQLGTTQTYGASKPYLLYNLTNYDSSLSTADFPVDGKLDDVRVYNYARTPQQVVEDMNAGHPSGGSPIATQLLFWRMDEMSGTTINNSGYGGSTYNGTATGTVWNSAAACVGPSPCLYLDTDADTVSAGAVTVINGASAFTFSTWLKPALVSTNSMIFSKADVSTDRSFQIKTDNTTASEIKVMVPVISSDTSTYFVTSGFGLSTTGAQLTVVYDGTQSNANRVKVYKNGKIVAGSISGTLPSTITTSSENLKLGKGDDTGSNALHALYDNVKFYTGALTPDQVIMDYNAGAAANFGTGPTEATQSVDGIGSDPVGYWALDENTGTTAKDKSGNNSDGTLTNGPVWVQGKIGQAVQFANTTNKITIPDNSNLDIADGEDVTITGWFYRADATDSNMITAKRTGSAAANTGWLLYLDGTIDTLLFEIADGAQEYSVQSARTFVTPGWHHFAVVWDESSAAGTKVFIDGIDNTGTKTGTIGSIGNASNATAMDIGNWEGTSSPMEGIIDDLKFYKYTRTASQIAYDYDRGKAMHWWKADECTGTTLNDSGNANTLSNGTITVGVTGTNTTAGSCTGSTSELWKNSATGKFNSGLYTDGTDDYADLGDLPNTETQSQLSWSFWVNPTSLATAKCIFCKANSAATQQGWFFRTDASTSTTLRVGIPTGTTDQSTYGSVTTALSNGAWKHVVAVFDGTATGNSNRLKIYINGKLQTTTYTGTIPAATTATTSNARLGAASDTTDYFNGRTDDVRIFSYPLSLQQVQKLYSDDASVRFGPVTGSP
ncbi:MAG: LamG domain-containing protein [Candidatus Woesebacteria bacterium]